MTHGLTIDTIDERFIVHGRMAILSLLNELIHRHEPVTVHFNDDAGCFVTRLLEARDKTLIFDAGSDRQTNQRLLAASACNFLAYPDGIRVQFSSGAVQPVSWDGSDVFCVPLPDRLARLQRQESFRILVPAQQALHAELFARDGTSLGAWPLHDLSVGGLGVNVDGQPDLALGPKIARAHLSLPQHGEIDCAASLRHATDLAGSQGKFAYRIGVAFSDLMPEMRAAIQRYIIHTAQQRSPTTERDIDDAD